MSKLLDTWAWIEFYDGSEKGEEVYRLLESDEKIHTSVITLAELSDNFQRGNFSTDHNWEELEVFIRTNTDLTELNPKIASRAGEIKDRKRKEFPDFGLMDGIILATAEEKNLELVSGDPHLKGEERTLDLEK